MKPTDFSKYLTDFFGTYLPIECGVSQNTILTYSYTFSLLIEFLKEQEFINPQRVTLADITKERIINFLQWLEEDRHCSVSTRNARLAAIRSFYSYLQYRDVKGMFRYHEIMSIRKKKTAAPEMAYLTIDGIKLILSQPDLKTRYGRRDFVLLSLLYDSGARVQELIDLTPPNIEFNDTATVKLCGKGNKARIVPLSKQQASNLKKYMYDEGLMKEDRHCTAPQKLDTFGVFFMKYNYEIRLKAVKLVLEGGLSVREAGCHLGCGRSQVHLWVTLFERHGLAGLKLRHGSYSAEFKLSVLKHMHQNHLSLLETAVHFGIPGPFVIRQWERLYQNQGAEGLRRKPQRRRPAMSKSKTKKVKLKTTPHEELLKELEYLRAENAYLKKLQALVEERIVRESGKEPKPSKD